MKDQDVAPTTGQDKSPGLFQRFLQAVGFGLRSRDGQKGIDRDMSIIDEAENPALAMKNRLIKEAKRKKPRYGFFMRWFHAADELVTLEYSKRVYKVMKNGEWRRLDLLGGISRRERRATA